MLVKLTPELAENNILLALDVTQTFFTQVRVPQTQKG